MEGARVARSADLEVCARLLERAMADVAELRGGPELLGSSVWPLAPAPVDPDSLGARWRGDGRVLLVGTIDEVVVGVGAGHVVTGAAERVGVVDCCYVEAAARGVGVGNALAAYLLDWFATQGCAAVEALALPGDRATKQLFEAQGLSARLLVLRRRLP